MHATHEPPARALQPRLGPSARALPGPSHAWVYLVNAPIGEAASAAPRAADEFPLIFLSGRRGCAPGPVKPVVYKFALQRRAVRQLQPAAALELVPAEGARVAVAGRKLQCAMAVHLSKVELA